MNWMDDASCREVGHQAFFPEYGTAQENHMAYRRAIVVCQSCPVRQQCYEYVAANPDIQHGIWAGHYAQQIRKQSRKETAA